MGDLRYSYGMVEDALKKAFDPENVTLTDLKVEKPPALVAHLCSSLDFVTVRKTQGQTLNLFIKRMIGKDAQSGLVRSLQLFDKEVLFFTQIVPKMVDLGRSAVMPMTLDFLPKCYYANRTLGSEMLVFENLSQSEPNKYVMLTTDGIGHDLDHAEAAMRGLATLHAVTQVMDMRMSEPFLQAYPFVADTAFGTLYDLDPENFLFSMSLKHMSQVLKEGHPEKYRVLDKLRNKIGDIGRKMVTPQKPFNALGHGDLWGNNLMFTSEKPIRIKLVDWQVPRYAPVTVDLVHYIYTNTNPKFRKQHLHHLLEVYHKSFVLILNMLGVDQIPFTFDELVEDYYHRRILGFIYFIPTLTNVTHQEGTELMDPDDPEGETMRNFESLVLNILKSDSRTEKARSLLLPVYEEFEKDLLAWV